MNMNVREDHVTSRDGTRIGFIRRGTGPGIVLIQGAMGTADNFADLATALSDTYSVYTPDRRGRGMSPRSYDQTHDISRDVEDIDAVLEHSGASQVFGLSSGAVITLEAARTLSRVSRIAIYEPPFYEHGISHDGVARLNAEIENGEFASALVSALTVAETAPAPLRMLPTPIARLLASLVLWIDGLRNSSRAKLRDLLPGIRYDFNDVAGQDGKIEKFSCVEKPVLLLSGTLSPQFLRQSIRKLEGILPQAQHIEFEGLGHSGPWNAGFGGRPGVVAAALRDFFV